MTTLELDRAKAAIYAEANIPEYWLILAKDKAVEVYTEPRNGRYAQRRLYTGADAVVATMLPALKVELEVLFRD